MRKTILYRLFGLGSIPGKLLPVLEKEGIVVLDEGMGGVVHHKACQWAGKALSPPLRGLFGMPCDYKEQSSLLRVLETSDQYFS